MNENLVERFGRSRQGVREVHEAEGVNTNDESDFAHSAIAVRQYFSSFDNVGQGNWLNRPEVPGSAEVLDADLGGSSSSDVVELSPNKVDGPWPSKEEYLQSLYELLREDAVRPLREAVLAIRSQPTATEDHLTGIGIYEKVHVCGLVLSMRGAAIRITFSLFRAGKQIIWEQSKRLMVGSLVVLTPADDMFQKKAIVATVAARPLDGLRGNPPEIDLFFARPEELEIDPALEYIMIQEHSSFFEAQRHTLRAMQRMIQEPFPLSEHLVGVQTTVPAPSYVQSQPKMDLSTVYTNYEHGTYNNVDIVDGWPTNPQSDLDPSQLDALRRILSKQLAIIQGPPGTGKTHVSVRAIKVMLANHRFGDPPIIIACQTNHAVDQILRHIAVFEPEFVRLGGMSKDREIIKPRTLYEVRKSTNQSMGKNNPSVGARRNMLKMQDKLKEFLEPLKVGNGPLNHRLLEKLGIITKRQADSLESGASKWIQKRSDQSNQPSSPFKVWLGDKLVPVPPKQMPEEYGFDFEEVDLEFEQLKELEAENVVKDDEVKDYLDGPVCALADNFTCQKVPGAQPQLQDITNEPDMWKIPQAHRGFFYRYLQTQLKQHICEAVRTQVKAYDEQANQRRIGFWQQDVKILAKQKIIGMTTTGLSKYRAMLTALNSKVVLIEEAAETLEPPVTVACMPSVEHLILVGDHKQLRPHTHVKELEKPEWALNVSLFERMVNNNVEYSMLNEQRRMIPEVRRLLYPIYGNGISDHPTVSDPAHRPDVPGMGGINSLFFSHDWPEQRDDLMSFVNPMEAEMIAGFVEYLVCNGMETRHITVLTFYNAQRKRILWELRKRPGISGQFFTVVTVDSYQGEENHVVILSLVRSNKTKDIGFLSNENRVCVALSRAQCGFYLFGNGRVFFKSKGVKNQRSIWEPVMQMMAGQVEGVEPRLPSRIFTRLPLCCENHGRLTQISSPEDWSTINGGCHEECTGTFACGHLCTAKCHPLPHGKLECPDCQAKKRPSTPVQTADFRISAAGPHRMPSIVAPLTPLRTDKNVYSKVEEVEPLIDFSPSAELELEADMDLISLDDASPKSQVTVTPIQNDFALATGLQTKDDQQDSQKGFGVEVASWPVSLLD